METITNVASTITTTASKAIWGDQTTQANETVGKEPVSGQLGKGTAESPYDQGNAETPKITDENKPTIGDYRATESSLTDNTITADVPKSLESNKTPITPLADDEKTGVTLKPEPGEKTGITLKTDASTSDSTNPLATTTTSGDDLKDKKDPSEKSLAELTKNKDPNDHSGEPMKMHDGSETGIGATQEERRTSKAGNPGGQEHGKEAKGTGEQWVKSTGLATDGGNFDATKPGAGKEADRLLEEKGVKKTDTGAHDTTSKAASNDSSEKKEKIPTIEKIKNKLHIGHRDK